MTLSTKYAVAILRETKRKGFTSAVALCGLVGTKKSNVSLMLKRMHRDGIIHMEPYRGFILTKKGVKIAEESERRAKVVARALKKLGLTASMAVVEAEKIAGEFSAETIKYFEEKY